MYWSAASSDGDGQMAVEKWSSVANHVVNIHHGHGDKFTSCEHEELDGRQWILNGMFLKASLYTQSIRYGTQNEFFFFLLRIYKINF
jgi:hypothetical protein